MLHYLLAGEEEAGLPLGAKVCPGCYGHSVAESELEVV